MDNEHTVYVKLKKEKGKRCLDTNVYEYLKGFRRGIINSDILGAAFEPEEPFENPDGSAIILRRGLSRGAARPFHIAESFRLCGGGFSS